MEAPQTRYATRPDGVSIAYQVVGSGPIDLVYVPGFISHLDLQWTDPGLSRFMRRLAGFARVIMFDKPGTGCSDPVSRVPVVEERIADVATVMDAACVRRPALMGFSEGAATALVFAATWPERLTSLVLYGGVYTTDPDPEMGIPRATVDDRWRRMEHMLAEWGTGATLDQFVPSQREMDRRFWALFERAAASPAMARALVEAVRRLDVTGVAASVSVPTLIVHRTGDFAPVEASRWIAERIPDATLVELPGDDHAFWTGDSDPVVDEIEQFLTGARNAGDSDRALLSVLFTDLVDSTARAAELGDATWRGRLEAHDALVRRTASTFRGRVVKAMGDGHLCVFDGPARAIRCALAIRDAAEEPVRAGVHTGECETIGDDVAGMAVHIGARIAALAAPSQVLVSGTVRDLVVGSPMTFSEAGEHALKGVPGSWRLYAVGPAGAPPPIAVERQLTAVDRAVLGAVRRAPTSAGRVAALARRLSRPRA